VPGGSERVRVPATFTIRPGRVLSPRSVSAPAFLAVDVTIISADGHAHAVVIRAERSYRLKVPQGGSETVRIGGQRAGEYPILVDGRNAGHLSIGGEPGP
jgi:hypothetical protein